MAERLLWQLQLQEKMEGVSAVAAAAVADPLAARVEVATILAAAADRQVAKKERA
jgi:hypothetical protein